MKIKKEITENYKTGVDIFRRSIVKSTLELCKMIDTHKQGAIYFSEPVVLSSARKKKSGEIYDTRIFIADNIRYNPDDEFGRLLYCLDFGNSESFITSPFLSLDDLDAVYKAVLKAVKAY